MGHTTSSCSRKINIGKIINGDKLIDFLKYKCAFEPIENDQVNNIYHLVIDWPKIKYLRCQQLLCSTKYYVPLDRVLTKDHTLII